jgi:hypothetical protein
VALDQDPDIRYHDNDAGAALTAATPRALRATTQNGQLLRIGLTQR